jgi:hypothetical protein
LLCWKRRQKNNISVILAHLFNRYCVCFSVVIASVFYLVVIVVIIVIANDSEAIQYQINSLCFTAGLPRRLRLLAMTERWRLRVKPAMTAFFKSLALRVLPLQKGEKNICGTGKDRGCYYNHHCHCAARLLTSQKMLKCNKCLK